MYISTATWDLPLDTPLQLLDMGKYRSTGGVVSWRALSFWNLHLYRCHGTLSIDGKPFPIRPGFASLMPPMVEMTYDFPRNAETIYVHFNYPPQGKSGALHAVPVMQSLGQNFGLEWDALEESMSFQDRQRRRTEIRIWNLLWNLADRGPAVPRQQSQYVSAASQYIEKNLAASIAVAELAAQLGITQGYLTRLFRRAYKTTVVGYIRKRRVQHARHLLTQTTLSIKAIAQQVGLGDLHYFNKTIRRELGRSPRRVRESLR